MAKRVRDDGKEQYWRQVLARWRSSGLSVRAYCELHRIPQPSFYWWRREIPRRDNARPQFLPGERKPGAETGTGSGNRHAISIDGNLLDRLLAN